MDSGGPPARCSGNPGVEPRLDEDMMLRILLLLLVLLASCTVYRGQFHQYRGTATAPSATVKSFETFRRTKSTTFLTYTATVVRVTNPLDSTWSTRLSCWFFLGPDVYDTVEYHMVLPAHTAVLVYISMVYSDYFGPRLPRSVECSVQGA